MGKYIFDVEANSLDPTKIWVLSWHNIDTNKSGSITDYPKMRRFLLQEDMTLIGHNIIRWDKGVLERLLGIKINARLIDTLPLSWYLYPKREKHGLGFWGEDLGISKPVIESWEELPIEEYINRCEEDVKINLQLFKNQIALLEIIYNNDVKEIDRCINYLCYKIDCAREQEDIRWKLDEVKTRGNLENFKAEFIRKESLLASHMPEKINYKTLKKPKIFFKKDGTVGKLGENWLSLLAELGLDEDYDEPLKLEKDREIGNPGSHQQLKEWLSELGWIPTTFKYDRNKETGAVRKIPQISLPRGEGLCSSVKRLYVVEPALEELDMLYVIKHRIGILKGFLRDVKDGYIQARIAGLTNTLRFKHAVAVNLPGYTGKGDWRDGEHIRGCLIAPKGHVLCGSDMSSLEDRTKQHYMYYFDPKYVEAMNVKGFDPHLDLAAFGYEMTNGDMGMSLEDIEWFKNGDHSDKNRFTSLKKVRSEFKTVNYGAVYGVGAPTMSRTTGMPEAQCTILLKAYWQKNWSVKEIAKACVTKKIGNQMWLHNPVSKFWYSLRATKDKFSTLNQGTGVYVFDSWVRGVRDKGYKLCGQFHDEIVLPVEDKEEVINKTREDLKEAISNVNKTFSLNREMDIDIQFGNNYSEIH